MDTLEASRSATSKASSGLTKVLRPQPGDMAPVPIGQDDLKDDYLEHFWDHIPSKQITHDQAMKVMRRMHRHGMGHLDSARKYAELYKTSQEKALKAPSRDLKDGMERENKFLVAKNKVLQGKLNETQNMLLEAEARWLAHNEGTTG